MCSGSLSSPGLLVQAVCFFPEIFIYIGNYWSSTANNKFLLICEEANNLHERYYYAAHFLRLFIYAVKVRTWRNPIFIIA